jgi:hypothetical protein
MTGRMEEPVTDLADTGTSGLLGFPQKMQTSGESLGIAVNPAPTGDEPGPVRQTIVSGRHGIPQYIYFYLYN